MINYFIAISWWNLIIQEKVYFLNPVPFNFYYFLETMNGWNFRNNEYCCKTVSPWGQKVRWQSKETKRWPWSISGLGPRGQASLERVFKKKNWNGALLKNSLLHWFVWAEVAAQRLECRPTKQDVVGLYLAGGWEVRVSLIRPLKTFFNTTTFSASRSRSGILVLINGISLN